MWRVILLLPRPGFYLHESFSPYIPSLNWFPKIAHLAVWIGESLRTDCWSGCFCKYHLEVKFPTYAVNRFLPEDRRHFIHIRVYMQNRDMSFWATGRSDTCAARQCSENLGLLPEIAFENEILTCMICPANHTQVQVSSLRSSEWHRRMILHTHSNKIQFIIVLYFFVLRNLFSLDDSIVGAKSRINVLGYCPSFWYFYQVCSHNFASCFAAWVWLI